MQAVRQNSPSILTKRLVAGGSPYTRQVTNPDQSDYEIWLILALTGSTSYTFEPHVNIASFFVTRASNDIIIY